MKARACYAVGFIVIILLGLASRSEALPLPAFVTAHAGDALWAAMIYSGVRILAVRRSMRFAALLSLLICCCVELSQLYQAKWINLLRDTTIGALVLGHGFLAIDLVRYGAGIGLALLLDAALHRLRSPSDVEQPLERS